MPGRLLIVVILAVSLAGAAMAQTAGNEESEWTPDVYGVRHFSGLRCPDVVGFVFRTKLLSADADRMAGCVYAGDAGMQLVLRSHLSGTGARAAETFLESYRAAGFHEVSLTGPASRGISFQTRDWAPGILCETLWYFNGKKADYSLWMSYSLPSQEADIVPALKAFEDLLARQN
ncbi:hypothetical protein [Roseibium litorale]|nr:hypothetical protein [Roseibium litorale]